MEQRVILRGLLMGALGGVLSFIYARIFAEPVIQRAIDYESGRDDAMADLARAAGLTPVGDGPDIFSRTIQANIGIGFGMLLFGVAMGGIFAVVYCVTVGRIGDVSARAAALLVGGGLFFALYVVPFVKYPPNPPSIGHPETIKDRSGLYVLMVALSVVFLFGAVVLGRRLATRFNAWTSTLLAAGAFIVAMGIVMGLLPSLGQLSSNVHEYGRFATETPQPLTDKSGAIVYPGFPADDLYAFRFHSFVAQLILWTTISVGFASLADRLFGPADASGSIGAHGAGE
jgi:hypothetical protein